MPEGGGLTAFSAIRILVLMKGFPDNTASILLPMLALVGSLASQSVISGKVFATTAVDPDGAGPLPANVVAGGQFANGNVALWDETQQSWLPMGGGVSGTVYTLTTMSNGDVIAEVQQAPPGSGLSDVLRWDGTAWTALATSIIGRVKALHETSTGDLMVGGTFSSIGGTAANNLAVWDGINWSAFGGGANSPVSAIGELSNGDLVIGGSFTAVGLTPAIGMATWNGTTWSSMGSGLVSGLFSPPVSVNALLNMPNGDLVISGAFQTAGGVPANNVARWNGSTWSSMGSGIGGINVYHGGATSATLHNGNILVSSFHVVAGNFFGQVRQWDGASWNQLGGNLGNVVWSVLGAPGGDLFVGGDFWLAGSSLVGSAMARWQSSQWLALESAAFPAVVEAFGAACPGSGGNNILVAESLPWTGSTFAANGSELAPLSLVAIDGGLSPLGPLSLASLGLPAAAPNCLLHITPTYLEVAITTTGEHRFEWSVPNNPIFAGVDVYFQYVVLEVDASLNVLETTSTNALKLTIGSL
ncbi:MAG: hypothetical protein ACI89X_003181 [Planctomycetota bacterium]|jgi:hypothetical protein